jgi:hypothetical protein
MRIPRLAALTLSLACLPAALAAQENYEIQVYPGTTVPAGTTMFELHSNFTGRGSRTAVNGLAPTNHAVHETIEITHGFTDWMEIGFYQFLSIRSEGGFQYVGNHIRPRIAVPERLGWPVGLSLSQEIGYQRSAFSEDSWNWEIRPIVDQQIGRLYWAFNPVLGVALKGANAGSAPDFEPNAQVGFDVSPRVNLALEYYGGFGPVDDLAPIDQAEQMLVPAVNIDFGPDWEFNAGFGVTLTSGTDLVAFKTIFGRRVGGPR